MTQPGHQLLSKRAGHTRHHHRQRGQAAERRFVRQRRARRLAGGDDLRRLPRRDAAAAGRRIRCVRVRSAVRAPDGRVGRPGAGCSPQILDPSHDVASFDVRHLGKRWVVGSRTASIILAGDDYKAAQLGRWPNPSARVPLARVSAERARRLAQAARSIAYSLWSPPRTGLARTARAGTGCAGGNQFAPMGACMLRPRWERPW